MEDDGGSYRLAVSPELPDDGRTPDGLPRALRFKGSLNVLYRKKNEVLLDLKQEVELVCLDSMLFSLPTSGFRVMLKFFPCLGPA